MRAAIVNEGVVLSVIDLGDKVIDPDGGAARGPASYSIEGPAGTEVVEYESLIEAPAGAILVATDEAAPGWSYSDGSFQPPPVSLEQLRGERLASVLSRVAAILAAGAPAPGGLHLALDDGSRADLTAMATTAIAAAGGALPWPPSYAQGWITSENVRVPLPAPADGLALAAGAGAFYAQVVQNGRDLKDAILVAEDSAALSAIDIEAGWPGA